LPAEGTPHHVSPTDEWVRSRGGACKMKPPLRTAADVAAIKEGLADGTIECLASDHAPHGAPAGSFADAPFGIIGLESALAVYIAELVLAGTLSWPELIAAMSTNPARALGLKGKGTLAAGADADVTIIDPAALWTIDAGNFKSKSRNCPWHGREVRGKVLVTIVGGRLVHDARGAK
ncbi:MAG: amidohydrolase family protein, partial [Planctomycetia bacterium]|nr:amidohydrolase family protein [Planctomycetia bacterium]